MQILVKLALSVAIILAATAVARRFPSLAGLIGVMPLTGALVMAWVYIENRGDPGVMGHFLQGALWGILPSVVFFLAAYFCVRRGLPLAGVMGAGFAAWLAAAGIHQWLLGRL